MIDEDRGEPARHAQPARGAMFLLFAQAVILISGFGISIILGRELGPEMFGTYGVVIAVLTLFERVLAGGIPRAAAGMIAREQANREDLEQSARVLLLLWGAILTAVLWIGAPALGRYFDTESHLFRILALNIPVTAVFLGYDAIFTGRREFAIQSLLQTVQSVVKLAGVFVLLVVGLSVAGAVAAHVVGTFAVAAIALIMYPPGLGRPPRALMQTIVRDGFTVGFYTVALALLLSAGLWQLDALGPQEAMMVGLYVAGMNVARALAIVPASLSVVLFSSAAWATGAAQQELFKKYVRETVRLAMILLFPACVLIAIDAENIVQLLFGAQYAGGGVVLAALCAVYVTMGFFDILAHVLMAEGRYKFTAVLTSALVPVLVALNSVLIPAYEGVGAAASMIVVFTIGILVTGAQVYRKIGGFVHGRTVLRTIGACALIGAISAMVPASGYWQLSLKLVFLGALYLGLLWASRELSAADLAALIKKKAKSTA